jgi:hypothetical protein
MTSRQRMIVALMAIGILVVLGIFAWLVINQESALTLETPVAAIPDPPATDVLPGQASSPTFPIFTATGAEHTLTQTTAPFPTHSATPVTDCVQAVAGGLGTDIYTIVQAMPGPDSNGMRIPTSAEMQAWQELVLTIAAGDSARACQLIAENAFPYELVRYQDVRSEDQLYWMLRERLPVTAGWGTYVIRSEGVLAEIIVEVPHPVADWRTDPEGVAIFRELAARALFIAGTHRCANSTYSPCSGQTAACGVVEPYRTSDVAHATQSMFQAAHQALLPCGGDGVAIQLHANDLASCPDLFISNGTLFPAALTLSLGENFQSSCPGYTLDIADGIQPECAYTSGDNVQARYSNGCTLRQVQDACTAVLHPADPEQFLSLEQSTLVRQDFACLVEGLQTTFP